jgi:hypothetical protein
MMFLCFLVVLAICGRSFGERSFPSSWEEFDHQYGKSMESMFRDYRTAFTKKYVDQKSEAQHFATFSTRVKDIFDFNGAKHSWFKGINGFTDLSDEERRNYVMPETKASVSIKKFQLFCFESIIGLTVKFLCFIDGQTKIVRQKEGCCRC